MPENTKTVHNKQELTKGSALKNMTTEEFISWMKGIPLQLYLAREKERNLYIETLDKNLSELNEDAESIKQFLLSEKKRIENEIFITKLKKNGNTTLLLTDKINVLAQFNSHYINLFENKEKISSIKTDIEKNKDNLIDTKLKKTEEELSAQENPEELPYGFFQIKCDAKIDYIERFFFILSKAKNPINHEPFMEENHVKELLEKNFEIFGKISTGKYFPINLTKNQKVILRYFMFQFYQKAEINFTGTKYKYANFLIHNFEIFKDDKLKTLVRNMCESKKPTKGNVILIDKYLNK